MIWEIELKPRGTDHEAHRIAREYDLLNHATDGAGLVTATSRGYLIEGNFASEEQRTKLLELLTDSVTEEVIIRELSTHRAGGQTLTVLLKPGVMDPAAQSVLTAARDLGIELTAVRTFRRYTFAEHCADPRSAFGRVLANDAIEQVVSGPLTLDHLTVGKPYQFKLVTIPLRDLDDEALMKLSREGQLALNLAEMKTVQAHYRELGRDPTDVELETIAQTWSEHCSHKTLKGLIDYTGPDGHTRRIKNLLKETIFGATQELRKRLGADDWCVSVFVDNAGVVRFDEQFNVCFKVETHNRPSAIEPYGGANTGLGGVIRDVLGTGLGAKPICNTDVFCFAPPDYSPDDLPAGVLHPRMVMTGVVNGVRDYGNRMGIPTVNGAICFDERYLGNPLVYCGTVGLIPVDKCHKEPKDGDLIVAVGGRTGRDGIHGATFSSLELTSESESVSGGAVQIGNAITEKKLLDVLLQARDRDLYHAITDCGAGGFSSAIGEMGEKLGASVQLHNAPLKYEGLSYTEIWISEAQERMILAVPPAKWPELKALCESEDVEAAVLGAFEQTGQLRLYYENHLVGELSMQFLHDGRPDIVRRAECPRGQGAEPAARSERPSAIDFNETLKKILASWSVCSKEWVIRQYDHEVQGGTAIKPLVGLREDGPGDAAVIMPVAGAYRGIAIGCGITPQYGDLDPYAMAAAVIDEAVRNVVAVGADPSRVALLDNFCWGDTERPEVLGSLVRAAEACRDLSLAFGTPFISGKDSLRNEFRGDGRHIVIPPTLLISAIGIVPDVRQCVTMDLKEPGNLLYLVGETRDELGGSHFHLVHGLDGGTVPYVNRLQAPNIFRALHAAISSGVVRSCHDLSEGGLAVAAAEMAFAGGVGADLTEASKIPGDDVTRLFSESPTRFLVEVRPDQSAAFEQRFADLPLLQLGRTVKEPRLRIAGASGEWLIWANLDELKQAWQRPLREAMG